MTEGELVQALMLTLRTLGNEHGWHWSVAQRPDGGVTITTRQPDQGKQPQISLIDREEG